jgi:predicted CoA-binding protein
MDDSDKIRRILRTSRTMQEHGYRVIPVNPTYDTILGEKTYKKVTDIPEKVPAGRVIEAAERLLGGQYAAHITVAS